MPKRTLLGLLFAVLSAAVALPPARAETEAARAGDFIQKIGKEMAALVSGASSVDEKRQRLRPFIDRVVDVDAVARFCLGRHWRSASTEQQQEYLRLFHGVLLNNVVSRLGDYRHTEMHVVIGQPELREDGVHVPTVLERTGSPPTRVVWLVREDDGSPRIADVIAEGTSLRLTLRSDYNSFLVRHGDSIDALLAALREQAAQASR